MGDLGPDASTPLVPWLVVAILAIVQSWFGFARPSGPTYAVAFSTFMFSVAGLLLCRSVGWIK